MITVFTPTYNRAYIIRTLYESLCRQTYHDFEWIVVDDGSTDDTKALLDGFVKTQKINIRYIYQPNQGKHIAINEGVKVARGDTFFIVDSDDYLTDDALEWVAARWAKVKRDKRYAGIAGTRIHPDGNRIGDDRDFGTIDTDPLSLRSFHHVKGDLAEIWRTEVLRHFPFPIIYGERFCTEALIWGRISQKYILRYINRGIYVCEYLNDGLSANITRCRRNNPEYATMVYSELSRYPQIPFFQKIVYSINFWRFATLGQKSIFYRIKQAGPFSLFTWLPGKFFAMVDWVNLKRMKHQ